MKRDFKIFQMLHKGKYVTHQILFQDFFQSPLSVLLVYWFSDQLVTLGWELFYVKDCSLV